MHDSAFDRCHPGNELYPWVRLPGSFEIGCGVTVLGGDDDRNWSQRYKANLEKLASGDLVQVFEVVRDLAGREAGCGLSAGEKRMLAKHASYSSRRADTLRVLNPLVRRAGCAGLSSATAVRAKRQIRTFTPRALLPKIRSACSRSGHNRGRPSGQLRQCVGRKPRAQLPTGAVDGQDRTMAGTTHSGAFCDGCELARHRSPSGS
jgi:hypothetical protein